MVDRHRGQQILAEELTCLTEIAYNCVLLMPGKIMLSLSARESLTLSLSEGGTLSQWLQTNSVVEWSKPSLVSMALSSSCPN